MMSTTAVSESRVLSPKKFWPQELILGLLPLILAAQALFFVPYFSAGLRGIADFRQLYSGGYMIRTGHAKQLYDYDTEAEFENRLVPVGGPFMLPINHLAFEELLFVPFSLLPYRTAYWIFLGFNTLLLVVCCRLLRGPFSELFERWRWFLPLLFASFFPISRALTHGQDSIIMLTLLSGALWSLTQESELTAGILVGLGMFKFQIAIPIALLFLAWRRWRFCTGFAVSSLAAGLVSLWIVGMNGAREYAHTMVGMSVHLASQADMVRYETYPADMLNLRGLISTSLKGLLPQSGVQMIVLLCSIAVLLIAAKHRPSFELAIVSASLVSYHFLPHDASILIIPIAAALCSGSVWDGTLAILLLLAPMVSIIPFCAYLVAIPLITLFILFVRSTHPPKEFFRL